MYVYIYIYVYIYTNLSWGHHDPLVYHRIFHDLPISVQWPPACHGEEERSWGPSAPPLWRGKEPCHERLIAGTPEHSTKRNSISNYGSILLDILSIYIMTYVLIDTCYFFPCFFMRQILDSFSLFSLSWRSHWIAEVLPFSVQSPRQRSRKHRLATSCFRNLMPDLQVWCDASWGAFHHHWEKPRHRSFPPRCRSQPFPAGGSTRNPTSPKAQSQQDGFQSDALIGYKCWWHCLHSPTVRFWNETSRHQEHPLKVCIIANIDLFPSYFETTDHSRYLSEPTIPKHCILASRQSTIHPGGWGSLKVSNNRTSPDWILAQQLRIISVAVDHRACSRFSINNLFFWGVIPNVETNMFQTMLRYQRHMNTNLY